MRSVVKHVFSSQKCSMLRVGVCSRLVLGVDVDKGIGPVLPHISHLFDLIYFLVKHMSNTYMLAVIIGRHTWIVLLSSYW